MSVDAMNENEIYGELESGETFWLNPDWIRVWEEDEIQTCKEAKDEHLD